MDLVRAIVNLEESPQLHAARLLILLDVFAKDKNDSIEGLTKLAKLDFLLRYPVMLERALETKNKPTKSVELEEHERYSVESEMVRYRFGPWDHRYREILNVMVAQGLAKVIVEGRKVVVTLTDKGRENAKRLGQNRAFEPYIKRSKILKSNFDLTATNLMKFIYATFPEIISLQSNSPIST